MSRRLLACLGFASLVAVLATPATAQTSAFDARLIDMRPLVQVQAAGTTFAGKPFEVDVFIYRGGADVLASSVGIDVAGRDTTDRIASGLGDRAQMMALNGTFLRNHVLQQAGDCGSPAPDHVERYTLTYYGQKNNRQITVGGDYRGCPDETRAIFDAVCAYLWETVEAPIEYCAEPIAP
jgi:hypothetical protein